MIKAIFLDFEGVITNNPMILHRDFFDKIKDQISFEDFDARYKPAKIGKSTFKEVLKGFEKYEKYIFDLVKFRPGAKEVLENLYSKKIPLFLASNHIDYMSDREVEILGIEKYFKKLFFSHKLGLAKPDEKFFLEILKQSELKLKNNEMIFIDDAKRNLIIAKKLGFITVYLSNGIIDDFRNKIDYKADYEIDNILDIIKIVEELNKKK